MDIRKIHHFSLIKKQLQKLCLEIQALYFKLEISVHVYECLDIVKTQNFSRILYSVTCLDRILSGPNFSDGLDRDMDKKG